MFRFGIIFSKTRFTPIPHDFPMDYTCSWSRRKRVDTCLWDFAGLGTPHKSEREGLLERTAHQIAFRGEILPKGGTRANLVDATACVRACVCIRNLSIHARARIGKMPRDYRGPRIPVDLKATIVRTGRRCPLDKTTS